MICSVQGNCIVLWPSFTPRQALSDQLKSQDNYTWIQPRELSSVEVAWRGVLDSQRGEVRCGVVWCCVLWYVMGRCSANKSLLRHSLHATRLYHSTRSFCSADVILSLFEFDVNIILFAIINSPLEAWCATEKHWCIIRGWGVLGIRAALGRGRTDWCANAYIFTSGQLHNLILDALCF